MSQEQQFPQRHAIHMAGYDYSQPGFYFLTICTQDHRWMFGKVINEEMCLNRIGQIAQTTWTTLPERFPHLELDQYLFMPNHMHGILVLKPSHTAGQVPSVPLHEIVRTFKSLVTRRVHALGVSRFAWQGKYRDHIIRNDADLDRIRKYIINNPARWAEKKLHYHE